MKINEQTIFLILDSLYDNVLHGLPGTATVFEFADEYLATHGDTHHASQSLIKWQTFKCATSGFLTGLGGALVVPIALPADLAATYYIQMRMIAAVAHLNGHDVKCEQVKAFIYCCLLGEGMNDALKQAGLRLGKQLTKKAITSMSREIIMKVNRIVGTKLVSKLGKNGILGLSKFVPIAGGIVGAGVNGLFCYQIGKSACRMFPFQYNITSSEAEAS